MKKMLLAIAACLAVLASPARAFGPLSAPKLPSGGGGATAADIDQFLASARDADKLVGNAAIALVQAVGSKEANAKIESLLKAVKDMPDGAEKDAKRKQLVSTAVTEASSIKYEQDANVAMAANDAAKRNQIAGGLTNLAIGSVMDVALIAQGKKLVGGVPSPDIVDRLPMAKDALESLGSQASGIGSILSSTKSLLSKVGIDALPTKATDKAADVSALIE